MQIIPGTPRICRQQRLYTFSSKLRPLDGSTANWRSGNPGGHKTFPFVLSLIWAVAIPKLLNVTLQTRSFIHRADNRQWHILRLREAILLLPLIANKAVVAKCSQLASPIRKCTVIRVVRSAYCEIRTPLVLFLNIYFPPRTVLPQMFLLADLFWLRKISKDPHSHAHVNSNGMEYIQN